MRCPRCHSPHVRRSKRSAFEHLLALIRVFPYRCGSCGSRFFRFSLAPASD
jgi:transposase-like protein